MHKLFLQILLCLKTDYVPTFCQRMVSKKKRKIWGKSQRGVGGTPFPNPLFFCTVPLRRHKNFQCFCLLNKGKILGNFPQILLESIPDGSLVGNNWVQILWTDAFVESLRSASSQRSSHQKFSLQLSQGKYFGGRTAGVLCCRIEFANNIMQTCFGFILNKFGYAN